MTNITIKKTNSHNYSINYFGKGYTVRTNNGRFWVLEPYADMRVGQITDSLSKAVMEVKYHYKKWNV